jgi:hypothetical protein
MSGITAAKRFGRRLAGMVSPRLRRLSATVLLPLLALGTAAGCGGEGSDTSCSVGGSCTVTFHRGVNAGASVLGIKTELVGVRGDQVTLKIAGQTVTVPVNGERQAGGFDVSVESVTKDKVVVKIAQGGG